MSSPRHFRNVVAAEPALRRFCERLDDPEFPTPAETAEAERTLAQARGELQAQLPLQQAGKVSA